MTIIFPAAPAGSEESIRPALEVALNSRAFRMQRELPRAASAHFSLSPAWQGYFLTLDSLLAGAGPDNAIAGNWHRLVFINGEAVMDAQLVDQDDTLTFSSLNIGPVAPATVNALRQAENSASLDDDDCEMRLLSVAALHLVTVWLHGAQKDVFIPIAPTPASLRPAQVTDWSGLSRVLIPAAQAMKKSVDADVTGCRGS